MESWTLLRFRIHRAAAETFWDGLRSGIARIETVGPADLHTAWAVGQAFPDQDFSLVDRTSFSVMERLGVDRAASFDNDFAVYRFGPRPRSGLSGSALTRPGCVKHPANRYEALARNCSRAFS